MAVERAFMFVITDRIYCIQLLAIFVAVKDLQKNGKDST